ncbi:hypothetical protein F5876DRAFT_77201 [Lentinula aff. lateritia]|uniref:Uncharacterized protein n=1 Tax=Lentinula aff. lateritia TaxID=2804960 RepID=A0ACC1TZH3_9AGAR|nr:hypothetical protein F5876DRAFT_77201 [Lentinula aff. lateritia]
MTSNEEPGSSSPIHAVHIRQKHQVQLRLISKWLYILTTRVVFLVGLSVIARSLSQMLTQVKLETKSLMWNRNRALYQNQSLEAIIDRSQVVQPLIRENQLFDIAVTIWARASKEEETEWKERLGKDALKRHTTHPFPTGGGPFELVARLGYSKDWDFPFSESKFQKQLWPFDNGLFKIIHSDIAFRQLRISDIKHSTINFSVPSEYFRDWEEGDGLQAAFTILPTTPSLLNHVRTFSSWIHADGITPKRAWPFPMGSPATSNKTITDEATDLLSFVMPLIRLFETPNPCLNASDTSASSLPPFSLVPYVTSRTHIRILKEFEIMNFASFNESHNALKAQECGKFGEPPKPGLRFFQGDSGSVWVTTCRRDYYNTGILESLFELGVPLDNGLNRTEWAYAPYMEASQYGLGPKDFTPLPVELKCNITSKKNSKLDAWNTDVIFVNTSTWLNMSWHLTYSGVSMLERTIADSLHSFTIPENGPNAESNYEQLKTQDWIDQRNSLFGVHRESSSYPGRRLVLTTLSMTFSIIAGAFDALYWYTRSGTTFISQPGTVLLALANVVDCEFIIHGQTAWSEYRQLLPSDDWHWKLYQGNQRSQRLRSLLRISRFVFVVFLPLQTIWMLMTVARIELIWPSGSEETFLRRTLPTIRRMRPNHSERATERLERSLVQGKSRVAIVLGLFLTYHFMLPHVPQILDPLHPEPDSSILEARMLYKDMIMKQSIVDPLFISGSIFQLLLNNSSGFFAGTYRIAAIFKMVSVALDVLQFVPWIVGLPEPRGGADAAFVIYAVFVVVKGWQASTLPRAMIDDSDEDED